MSIETTPAQPAAETDYLGMSDEDFLNATPPSFEAEEALEEPVTTEETDPEADPGTNPTGEDEDPEKDPETDPAAEGTDPDADPALAGEGEEGQDPDGKPEGEETPEGEEDPEKKEEEPVEPDYKAEYEKLLAPFKANGKELKVENVDEAIQLMQMGANYNKKMSALKPNLKLLKLLENNDLLAADKLGYLIDLSKKDPEAIRKLVKDSGIDPLDIDTEKESEYTPNTYNVDDRELELDAVLDKIQDTPTYSKTVNLVSNKWDGPSKQVVAEHPGLLEVINDHMQSGIYDRISSEVEKQRTFGRLSGLSDLEAYRTVGDELDAKGAFADLVTPAPEQKPPQQKVVVKAPKAEDPARASKKRAASTTRTTPASGGKDPDFNPLALSDEDFEKAINEKLM